MLRFGILIAFVATCVYAADHEIFKDCSRTPFCAKLRNYTIDSDILFAADLSAIAGGDDGASIITLFNNNGDNLYLNLYLLEGRTVRIKILEEDHQRYELVDILDSQPKVQKLKLSKQKERFPSSVRLVNDDENIQVIVTEGPPFTVQYYYDDVLEVVFNAERLFFDKDSVAFSFQVEFEGAEILYGLSHHAYPIGLAETSDGSSDPFRLRNSDNPNYETDSPMALYGTVPVLYGHSAQRTSGIFFHNAAEEWIDVDYEGARPSAYFIINGGTLDLFVLFGPTTRDVVRQFTGLTGVPHMPQLWTLGYHQCRFTYQTQEEVKDVVALMDAHNFQLDAIWLDDGHSFNNRYFLWNPENFSDPVEMQQNISATNRKCVTILDPHIKVDDNYTVYAGAKDKYFVRWPNGTDYEGDCWPGLSSWIDYLNPEASDYYSTWYHYDKFVGSTPVLAGVWNDMNEPAVFDNDHEKTMPFDVVHYGDVLHRDVHNIYGFLQTKSTHKGLIERDNGTVRPFILTRSHFAGSQRYAAMWTGDNTAEWPYILSSYSECMTLNLLGMVFCGADVGGFSGNPSPELFYRWFQAAAWLPFFRGHSEKGTERREPYVFDEETQDFVRTAIQTRYKHIPVFYTLFYEHITTGDPVIRPLFYHYPEVYGLDTHMLVGRDILVRPVFDEGATQMDIFFPGNSTEYWYRVDLGLFSIFSGGIFADMLVEKSTAPLFYRGGSIISRKDIVRPTTTDMLNDPYTLYVNLDSNGNAEGTLYIDDYVSFEYVNNNAFLYIQFVYLPDANGVRIHQVGGNSVGIDFSIAAIRVHRRAGDGTEVNIHTTTADGTPLENINISKQLRAREGDVILYL